MPKMRQNTFGGRAPPDPLAAMIASTSKGKGRRDTGGKGAGGTEGGEERGRDNGKEWAPTFWVKFTPLGSCQQSCFTVRQPCY